MLIFLDIHWYNTIPGTKKKLVKNFLLGNMNTTSIEACYCLHTGPSIANSSYENPWAIKCAIHHNTLSIREKSQKYEHCHPHHVKDVNPFIYDGTACQTAYGLA
jgi:tartrate dehydratase alpha subunit/fumarate hydratase class I-like protein